MALYLGNMKGQVMLTVGGTDTSDANATAEDIAVGKTAYVKGEKIHGKAEFGGMTASIFVVGLSESDTVTAIYGDKTKVAVWNSTESCHEITKIKDPGMWSISATDGVQIVTKEVLVDAVTIYKIEMCFPVNYLMLYNYGDECEEVTGEWIAYRQSAASANNVTKNADSLVTVSTLTYGYDNWTNGARTTNLINLSEYTAGFGVIKSQNTAGGTPSTWAYSWFGLSNSSVMAPCFIFNKTVSNNKTAYYCDFNEANIYSSDGTNYTTKISNILSSCYGAIGVFSGTTTLYSFAVVKADDWQMLCAQAGLSEPTDLATLIADTTSITAILADENAVKYMVSKCTGDFMASFVASADCLSALDTSPHKGIVYANRHWAKFLAMVQ